MITAAALAIASWSQSTRSPSWFDWRRSSLSRSALARCVHRGLDVGQRLAAVNPRFALAEQVEIGSVEDKDGSVICAWPWTFLSALCQ